MTKWEPGRWWRVTTPDGGLWSGRIVARGPDAPHRCAPTGDRLRTYSLPPFPPLSSGVTADRLPEPTTSTETVARPGDVYLCGCGKTWIARATVVSGKGVWGHGGYRTERESDWRREHWWERRRRQRAAGWAPPAANTS